MIYIVTPYKYRADCFILENGLRPEEYTTIHNEHQCSGLVGGLGDVVVFVETDFIEEIKDFVYSLGHRFNSFVLADDSASMWAWIFKSVSIKELHETLQSH